nr:hypothetical protein [Lysinibacillus timonensis]
MKITENLLEDYPESISIYLSPLNEIADNDWIKPENFKDKIISFISGEKGIVELPFVSIEVNSPTKYKQIKTKGDTFLATIMVDSTVLLSYDSKSKLPIIKDIYNVRSKTMTGLTYWNQTDFRRESLNYNLLVAGNLFANDQTIPDVLTIEYDFNEQSFIE